MAWEKASQEMRDLLAGSVSGFACQKKMVFGYPVYFVNDYMFAGLHGNKIFLRLSATDRERILGAGATVFEPNAGMQMKEYVVLPTTLHGDPAVLEEWLDRAFAFAASLPPKKAKNKKKA